MSESNLLYRGKSKDVCQITEGQYAGKYKLIFRDDATGYLENGNPVFDPGYDVVVGQIPGKGAIACRFATHFFQLLQKHHIPSHYIETISDNEMIVEPAVPLSIPAAAPDLEGAAPLQNLEFTWRNQATGSFWRRYPFVKPCQNLHQVVEAWTKGDSDILITFEALEQTGAMTRTEIDESALLVQKIAQLVTAEFAQHGLHVLDGKFELGRLQGGDGQIVIIDEISPDVLRVCRGYQPDSNGNCTIHQDCARTTCQDGKRTIKNLNQVKAKDFVSIFL
ncbi:MAG TPA: hypothetical protein ENN77_02190 [Candidatus Wirthbacteria bacterium]|nr:hypothetical protein [Candidatus Wirthbacteria bacterium]